MDTDRFITNLTNQAEDNPVLALGVAAALFTSMGQLLRALTWHKEVSRRTVKDRQR